MRINFLPIKHIMFTLVICHAVCIGKVFSQNYTVDFERITKNAMVGPENFAASFIIDMAVTPDNSHFVLGFSNEETDIDFGVGSAIVGATGSEYYIAKYSSDGDLLQARTFAHGLNQSQNFKLLVDQTNGQVTLVFWTSTSQTINFGMNDLGVTSNLLPINASGIVVIRLDADFNNIWHRSFVNGFGTEINEAILDNQEVHIVGRFATTFDPGDGIPSVTPASLLASGFWLTLSPTGTSTSFVTSIDGPDACQYKCITATPTHYILGVDFAQSFSFKGVNYNSVIGTTPTSMVLAVQKSNGLVSGFRNFSLGSASRSHIIGVAARPNGEVYALINHSGNVYPNHNGLNNQGVTITQPLSADNFALIKYTNHLQSYSGNLLINTNKNVYFCLDPSGSSDVYVASQSSTNTLNVGSGASVNFSAPANTQAAAIARFSSDLGPSSYLSHIPQFVANEFPFNLNFANRKMIVQANKIYSFSYLRTSHHAPHVALVSHLANVSTNQVAYSEHRYAHLSTLVRYSQCSDITPLLSSTSTTVCGGGQVTITNTAQSQGYTELFWQNGSCPTNPTSITGDEHQTFVFGNNSSTTWFARYLGACPSSSCASIVLTGHPNLNAGTISGSAQVCQAVGNQVIYSISGFNAPGVWSSSNPTVLSFNSVSGNSAFFNVNGSGSVELRYIVSNSTGCPADTAVLLVQVNQPVVLSTINGSNALCQNEIIQYSNATSGGIWTSFNPSVLAINATSGFATAIAPGTATIQYAIPAANGCAAASTSLLVTVNTAPLIGSEIIGSTEVCAGSTSSYSVTPSGAPAALSWAVSNSLATISQSGVLSANHAGTTVITYSATNAQGCSSSLQLNLEIEENLQAGTIFTPSTILCPNGTLQLTTSGDPGGVWSSSNTSFATVDAVTGLVTSTGTGSTIITYAHPASGGCAGSQTTFVLSDGLNGQAPLTAVSIPTVASVCSGAAYFIPSTITGGTGLNYQWSFNGVPIAGANQADLFLQNVSAAHFGIYTLEVSSSCSTIVSNSFQLNENISGSIQTQPQATTVVCENPGGSIQLQIAATGNPTSIEWTYFGVPTGGTGPTLTIPSLPENSGNYVAVVNYECATFFSNLAQVTINPLPVISSQPIPQTICSLGENVEFSAATNFAQTFEWQNLAGQTVSTNENLVLTNVTMAELNETYQLIASNSCGTVFSQQVEIELIGVPLYQSSGIGSIAVCEGESVQLEVDFSVNGNPVTQGIQWYVNGTLLSVDTHILQIQTDVNTQGIYTAVFQNNCGQVQSDDIELIVYETVQTTEAIWLCEGDTISVNGIDYFEEGTYLYSFQGQFGCDSLVHVDVYFFSKDNPFIVSNLNTLECNITNASFFQWYLNGTAISGANSSTFLPEESGIYYVEIINSSGCVEKSNELNYQTAGIFDDKIELILYPNPSNGSITIKSGMILSGHLTDLSGRIIQDITIETGVNDFQFNLAPGVYNLNFGNRVLPLVIQ